MENIKEKIRSLYIGDLFINKLHEIEGYILPKLISDEKAVKRYYKKKVGKELNLSNPSTFNEKINWYKLNCKDPLMTICADKIEMRKYVEKCGYKEYLNEIYGTYSNVDDLNIDELPKKFVIKAAHGTHMQIIVKDKANINWKQSKRIMKSWLKQNIYWRGREWAYKNMPHRLVAEKYIEDSYGELRDYKFFCFNGEPKFIQYDIGRYKGKHKRNFYDLQWNILDIEDEVGTDNFIEIEKPKSLEMMLQIARDLSKPFQFVRVDFYEVNEKPLIGELTFYHMGGYSGIKSYKWEKQIGDYWKIS